MRKPTTLAWNRRTTKPGMPKRPGWPWLAAIFLLLLGTEALADLPADPILRIEGGMHTSTIRRAATDAKFQTMATVSDDKTIRLWSLKDGRLLKTLRIPIGTGRDGKLFAVAMTPDGKTLAAAGLTGWEWDKEICIYIFDLTTGQITRRITGLSNVVNHLTFSKNGLLLAAVLAKNHGVRVFNVAEGTQVSGDSQYGDHTYWVDFDAKGRVVTASYDGTVRLYDPGHSLVAKRSAPEENRPFSATFSPDGKLVAVGYAREPRVEVLNAADLSLLYTPDLSGVNGKLHTVAWSLNGRYLYAAGLHQVGERRAIRRWDKGGRSNQEGRGEFVDLQVSKDTVMQILPLPENRLAFIAADPALGIYSEALTPTFLHERPNAVFRGIGDQFQIAPDGSMVQFSYDPGAKSMARFSLTELDLALDTDGDEHYQKHAASEPLLPVLTAKSAPETGWSSTKFLVNGRPIELKNHEHVYSFAFADDQKQLTVGSNFSLRLHTVDHQELWAVPSPATVWAVNFTKTNDMIVALIGDGTVRWYQRATGKELLALFPHNDRKQWIVWMPEGSFAASKGGDALIGWHKNRSVHASPDFFPASQFTNFHQPDVIKSLFSKSP